MHLFTPNPAPPPFHPVAYFGALLMSFVGGMMLSFVTMRYGHNTKTVRQASAALITAVTQGAEMKMTLVVRKDLKMSTGKAAAQCAHAAVGVVDEIHNLTSRPPGDRLASKAPWVDWHHAWRASGSKKVVLKVESEDAILALEKLARREGLPCCLVQDAGRTQIAAGSRTVLAVGPAPSTRVDVVTGNLPVL